MLRRHPGPAASLGQRLRQAPASVSLAVALLVAAIAGALVMTAAGTARIAQLRRAMRRTSTAGQARAPASDAHRDRNTGPGHPEPGSQP
jgi:hypothetical protein